MQLRYRFRQNWCKKSPSRHEHKLQNSRAASQQAKTAAKHVPVMGLFTGLLVQVMLAKVEAVFQHAMGPLARLASFATGPILQYFLKRLDMSYVHNSGPTPLSDGLSIRKNNAAL